MFREYVIPHGKHPNVYKGDKVIAGQQLTDGPVVLQDILKVCGDKVLQEYLVNEVQEVYRLQGVRINDKHIELIIRQMLKKVKIEDPGDTEFLATQQVDKWKFQKENTRVIKKGGKPAVALFPRRAFRKLRACLQMQPLPVNMMSYTGSKRTLSSGI
jgi:DNA-directed RNA polymerase subunit beta'